MPKLSIVIACLNDTNELSKTIWSIRQTAGDAPEIVVVDDCSSTSLENALPPTDKKEIKLITNARRCGCGPSRTVGVLNASGEYVLIIDSHMRFLPGWYEEAIKRIDGRLNGLHCATCLALDSQHMDPEHPVSEYRAGATINVSGPDRNVGSKWQVMEVVWEKGEKEDDAAICAPLGACYFIDREFFLRINPLANLKLIGCDELMLAAKVWCSGGECHLMRNVRIGHKFTLPKERQPFSIPPGVMVWNKLYAIHTLCPEKLARTLAEKLKATVPPKEWFAACTLFNENYAAVAVEKAKNQHLFVRRFEEYAEQFSIPLP